MTRHRASSEISGQICWQISLNPKFISRSLTSAFCTRPSLRRVSTGKTKLIFVQQKYNIHVGLSIECVGGSCLVVKCYLLDTHRGQDADKLFVVSKMVIIVQSHASPKWPLWKTSHSSPRLGEAFLTEERITSVEMSTSGCQMCGEAENLNIFMQNK